MSLKSGRTTLQVFRIICSAEVRCTCPFVMEDSGMAEEPTHQTSILYSRETIESLDLLLAKNHMSLFLTATQATRSLRNKCRNYGNNVYCFVMVLAAFSTASKVVFRSDFVWANDV